MSDGETEQGVAFEVAIGRSPVESLTQRPELPPHLRLRLQSYASSRPRHNLEDRMQAAERRRKRQMQRRVENMKAAEERCRRLVEAIDMVTDYRRHLDGEVLDRQPPSRNEVKAVYANIKQDLKAMCGRVERETRKLTDKEYVHEPQTYQPKRRVSHTDSCTCECCYLEDEAKKEAVKKDLSEILADLSSPESPRGLALSYESAPELHGMDFRMDMDNVSSANDPRYLVRSSAPIVIRKRQVRRVTWMEDSTEDEENSLYHAAPTIAVQTDDVVCSHCDTPATLDRLDRARSQKKDASCQTDSDLFACPCCRHHLA